VSRRQLLARAGLAGATLAAGLPLATAAAASQAGEPAQPGTRRKIVVAGGHPGDPEYGCGGTIARYTEQGDEVVLLYLNRGDWSGNDAGAVRSAEAAKACQILRARPAFAGQHDGRAIIDNAHYDEFHRLLEAERPQVVFTHWPIDNHADHRAISMLVYEAWLRMKKLFSLYYYEVSNGEDTLQFAPTHYVDISGTEALKKQACYAHATQAPDRYYALQSMVSRMRGIESGHTHAESFIRQVQSPDFTLPT